MNYCSKEHQKIDWTLGEHKALCGKGEKSPPGNDKHKYLLEEFDLVTEREETPVSKESDSEADDEARRMKEYEEFVAKQKESDDLRNVPDEEFDKYTSQIDDDKDFNRFKKRINYDPDQVIRFERGGAPLWITTKNQPKDSDIPACELCQSPRIFEFQVSACTRTMLPFELTDFNLITCYLTDYATASEFI